MRIAIACASGSAKGVFVHGVRRPRGRHGLSRATRLIEERGGFEGARLRARQDTERSLREIRRLPPHPSIDTLVGVTEKLLHRRY